MALIEAGYPVSGSVSSGSVAVCHFGSMSIAGRRFFAFLLRFLPISSASSW